VNFVCVNSKSHSGPCLLGWHEQALTTSSAIFGSQTKKLRNIISKHWTPVYRRGVLHKYDYRTWFRWFYSLERRWYLFVCKMIYEYQYGSFFLYSK
jgi:hypothetical protein